MSFVNLVVFVPLIRVSFNVFSYLYKIARKYSLKGGVELGVALIHMPTNFNVGIKWTYDFIHKMVWY